MAFVTTDTQARFFIDTLPNHPSVEIQKPSVGAIDSDPLIAKGWEKTVYVGSALLLVGIVVIVGVVSRKIEYALLLAFGLSVILIAFFLL